MTQVSAIVFGKEDAGGFNRCTFPVFRRPVIRYPILAALHAELVDQVYVSTGTPSILDVCQAHEGLKVIKRENECKTILEEVRRSVGLMIQEQGITPGYTVLLFGNSPCILAETLDRGIELLMKESKFDSVITVQKRHEFSRDLAMKFGEGGELNLPEKGEGAFQYFADSRMMIVRTKVLQNLEEPFDRYYPRLWGDKIAPIISEEGVSDIDYTWQVSLAERWLQERGFSDQETPYPESRPHSTIGVETKERRQEKMRVYVSTVPFGEIDPLPRDELEDETRCEYLINPIGRKLKEMELADQLQDSDILIAGTEPITARVMDRAKHLKLICRVGIGLDNVDLLEARKRGIKVSYTPDAPAPAVAELTMAHMLNACRHLSTSDRRLRDGVWKRVMGHRLANLTIGIIGTGRVGSRVLKHCQGFSPKKILVHDLQPDLNMYEYYQAQSVDLNTLIQESDIVTLHVPLTAATKPLLGKAELLKMKPGSILINTARGGMVCEKSLFDVLKEGHLGAACIDVFEEEPYRGELATLENCFMTCHMGSCSHDCRFEMEKLATEEALRFIREEELELEVPESEYQLREEEH